MLVFSSAEMTNSSPFQCAALPLAGIQVQHTTGFGSEIRITRKDPASVIPGANGILMQPAPQSTAADGCHQAALLDLLHQVGGAPAGERHAVRRRQLTGQGVNLNDEFWGEKSGGDPDGYALPSLRGGQQKNVCARERRLHGGCPNTRQFLRWASPRLHKGSSWLAEPENTATYIFRRASAIRPPRWRRGLWRMGSILASVNTSSTRCHPVASKIRNAVLSPPCLAAVRA
jgi:hypothetical protein